MASNNTEFYRGKRKKKGPSLIITIIVLSIVAFVVLLFYGLQKYIVISNDGLRLELPILMEDAPTQTDDEGNVTHSFEQVNAELDIGEPDYSNIKATAGENLGELKAVYVPAASVTAAGVDASLANVTGAKCGLARCQDGHRNAGVGVGRGHRQGLRNKRHRGSEVNSLLA